MTDVYRTLRMQRLGSIVIVQPFDGDKMAGQSLTCDLRTGTVALAEHHPIERDYTTILGVLGLFRMHKSTVFVVIDKAEEVGCNCNARTYMLPCFCLRWASCEGQ